MKRTIVILIVMILGMKLTFAQSHVQGGIVEGAFGYFDVSRILSQTNTAGTARMQAIGGAQVSLGGDLSSAYSNPAGLGAFNRSSFSFTPSLNFHSSEASFEGRFAENFIPNLNFNHLGAGFHHDGTGDYKGGTFAVTLTRINDFYNDVLYDGFSSGSSIIDAYLDRAHGIQTGSLNDELSYAYLQFLINPTFDGNGNQLDEYTSFIPPSFLPRQTERITTRGRQNQWDFSYGGNYSDKIYFGLGIGVSSFRYEEDRVYTESEFLDEENDTFSEALNAISTENTLDIRGLGANATFGVIARPIDILRVGLSIKTPTIYNIDKESSQDLQTEYNNFFYEPEDSVLNTLFDEQLLSARYNIQTPWKISFGTSVFLGKNGFISADIDYLNYSSSKVRSQGDFNVFEDNQTIRNIYTSTLNYRFGIEYRVGSIMLRGGYNYTGDPYKDSSINNSIQRISGGIGYRNQNFSIDTSIVHSTFDSQFQPFSFLDGSGPVASVENKNVNVSVTVGFNF